MRASKPKWVNSILYIIGVKLLMQGGLQIKSGQAKITTKALCVRVLWHVE